MHLLKNYIPKFLLGSLVFLILQYKTFFSKYVVNDDVFHHSIGFVKDLPNKFINQDIIIDAARVIEPKFYSLLYKIFIVFFDFQLINKLIPLILFSGLFLVLTKLLEKFQIVGLLNILSSLFLITSPIIFDTFPGGHSRSLGFLFMSLIFLFSLKKEHFTVLLFTYVLSSISYPVITVLSTPLVLYVTFIKFRQHISNLWKVVTVLFVLVSIFLMKYYSFQIEEQLGEIVTGADIMAMPEFSQYGRVRLQNQVNSPFNEVYKFLNYSFLNFTFKIKWLSFIFLIPIVIALFKKKFKEVESIILLSTSIVLFFMAVVFLFHLFIPARYLHYGLGFSLIILFVTSINKIIEKKMVLLSILSLFVGFNIWMSSNRATKDFSFYKNVFSAIDKLEEDEILIAANPYEASSIPYYNRVSTLTSFEASHLLYYKDYWGELKARTNDYFKAYYSNNEQSIKDFIKKYNINYIIVSKKDFDKQLKFRYFPPFNEQIESLLAEDIHYLNSPSSQYFLRSIDDNYSIFDCSKFLKIVE